MLLILISTSTTPEKDVLLVIQNLKENTISDDNVNDHSNMKTLCPSVLKFHSSLQDSNDLLKTVNLQK